MCVPLTQTYLFVRVLHTICRHEQRVTQSGWWWWEVKKVESKIDSFELFSPQNVASASTHPLAGQGPSAGPCGPPGFQTDSLWLRLNLAWLLTLRFRNTPWGRGGSDLEGWSLMCQDYLTGNNNKKRKRPNDPKTLNTRHARKQTWLKTKTSTHTQKAYTGLYCKTIGWCVTSCGAPGQLWSESPPRKCVARWSLPSLAVPLSPYLNKGVGLARSLTASQANTPLYL